MALSYARFQNNTQLQTASRNSPPLRPGAQGTGVKELQKAFADLGYPMPGSTKRSGEMDGIYGNETYATAKLFQSEFKLFAQLVVGIAKGMAVDGVVGHDTMTTLDALMQLPPERRGRPVATLPDPDPPFPRLPKSISKMTVGEKLAAAIEASLNDMPEEVAEQVKALIEPEAIGLMIGLFAVWAVSQYFGVGEIADVILLLTGAVFMGKAAIDAGEEIYEFGKGAANAQTDVEIQEAGAHFAKAVALVGVTVIVALLTHKAGKSLRRKVPRVNEPAPKPAGRIPAFYKTKVVMDPNMAAGTGQTSWYGDVQLSSKGTLTEQALVRWHEFVHSILTPRLMLLRDIRVDLNAHAYANYALLTYLEEALAETVSQVVVRGLSRNTVLEGVSFPVREGYVTVAGVVASGARLIIGSIIVGGVTFTVSYGANFIGKK